MAFHDESIFPGGIYWEGDDKDGDRTDVSVQGAGKGEKDNPHSLTIHITTGNATFALCAVTLEDMERLARWLRLTVQMKRQEIEEEKA